MSESIIVALITGLLTLVGVWIQNRNTIRSIISEQDRKMAVMQTKIEELTREVREHNGFAQRLPVVEEKVTNLAKRVERLEAEKE